MASKIYQLYGRRALSLTSAAGAGLAVDLATATLRCVMINSLNNSTPSGTVLAFSQGHDYYDDINVAAAASIFGNTNAPLFDACPVLPTTGGPMLVSTLSRLVFTTPPGTTLFTPGPAGTAVGAVEADALIIYKEGTAANVSPLICYIDIPTPFAFNGGTVTVTWNASGIFELCPA